MSLRKYISAASRSLGQSRSNLPPSLSNPLSSVLSPHRIRTLALAHCPPQSSSSKCIAAAPPPPPPAPPPPQRRTKTEASGAPFDLFEGLRFHLSPELSSDESRRLKRLVMIHGGLLAPAPDAASGSAGGPPLRPGGSGEGGAGGARQEPPRPRPPEPLRGRGLRRRGAAVADHEDRRVMQRTTAGAAL